MLTLSNRSPLTFTSQKLIFSPFRAFRLYETSTLQFQTFVVVTSWPPGYPLKVCNCSHFWHLLCILHSKTYGFCKVTLFRLKHVYLFLLQEPYYLSKSILSARLVLVKRSLVRKPYYLLCFRHPFFKEAALGRPKVCNCRQTDFFKTFFCFFHIFKHPLFRAANLSKMRLSLVRGVTFRI